MHISRKKHILLHNINMTPFVDIMLVLLIIFMISPTTENMPSLLVNLPTAKEATPLHVNQSIILTISSNGTIYINDKLSNEKTLKNDLISAIKNKDIQIFIRGDDKLNYGAIIRIINIVNSYGLKNIALVTKTTT
ncbi:ExbD/TolR family protein [Candidatus Neoehrlichia procyonis]|nr:biopolymer transporter ExbD [Candidatus Neoehrlichia lotoris]